MIGNARVLVRDASVSDLRAVAMLHRGAYSHEHFMALLPASVLEDYYGRFLGQGSHIRVVVDDASHMSQPSSGEMLGFAVYGRNIESRIARFKKDRRWSIVRTAVTHPMVSLRKLLSASVGWAKDDSFHVPAQVLLLSIAVAESGRGIGRVLLEDMLRNCAEAGEDRVGLYVRHRNVGAIRAYMRVGFCIVTSLKDQYYMERTQAANSKTAHV